MPEAIGTRIVEIMRRGGFYDRILSGGSELDRVKEYLHRLAGDRPAPASHPLQAPTYPCFPGLEHAAFHEHAYPEAVQRIEASFPVIRAEALAIPAGLPLSYTAAPKPRGWIRRLRHWVRPGWSAEGWGIHLLYHMGIRLEGLTGCCPRTTALIEGLPGVCLDYPWGDALLSIQAPGSSLPPHCSVDNLRLRCHLGIQIPENTGIRVGTETRTWSEGKCLLFEDSLEHEVWNRGCAPRIVLIVDFWHPDLTEVERNALTAGFQKAEVRKLFLRDRVQFTNAPEPVLKHLEAEIATQEKSSLIAEYWDSGATAPVS